MNMAIIYVVYAALETRVSDLICSRALPVLYIAVLATFPAHLVRRAFLYHGRKRAKV